MCRHGTHFLLLHPPSVPSRDSLKPRACQAGGGIFKQKEPKQLGLGARGGPAGCGMAGAEDGGKEQGPRGWICRHPLPRSQAWAGHVLSTRPELGLGSGDINIYSQIKASEAPTNTGRGTQPQSEGERHSRRQGQASRSPLTDSASCIPDRPGNLLKTRPARPSIVMLQSRNPGPQLPRAPRTERAQPLKSHQVGWSEARPREPLGPSWRGLSEVSRQHSPGRLLPPRR